MPRESDESRINRLSLSSAHDTKANLLQKEQKDFATRTDSFLFHGVGFALCSAPEPG